MASPQQSSRNAKRRHQWADLDDAFSTTKKPRTTKTMEKESISVVDFVPPSFEHTSKRPVQPLSGHASPFPTFDAHAYSISTNLRKAEKRFITPKPPELPLVNDIERVPTIKPRPISIVRPPVFEQTKPNVSTPATPRKRPVATILPLNVTDLESPPKPSTQEIEFDHGLAPSPEKRIQSSNKAPFMRGGLAEKAQALIAKSTTDFSLWHRDLSAGGKDLGAELHLRVLEIRARNHSQNAPLIQDTLTSTLTPLKTVLTICQRFDDDDGPQRIMVLFSTLGSSRQLESLANKVSNPLAISTHKEVLVWKPWIEISLPHVHEDGTTTETALLCSKFLVK
ncbi:hypothetical protein FRC18_011658 [Serendipita sp. 400]|nr:hypothetical protein FRC18_011658 [Serendipita sp. 400]